MECRRGLVARGGTFSVLSFRSGNATPVSQMSLFDGDRLSVPWLWFTAGNTQLAACRLRSRIQT